MFLSITAPRSSALAPAVAYPRVPLYEPTVIMTEMRRNLAVAFFADNSLYPNLGGGISPTAAGRVYWQNMVVMFGSAKKLSKVPIAFRLYTNVAPTGEEGELLRGLGVQVVDIPFSFLPPDGYHPAFGGSFYLFDVLKSFVQTGSETDQLIVLDPDCVWVDDPARCFSLLETHPLIAYDTKFPEEWPSNGQSRESLRTLAHEEGKALTNVIYVGGELIGLTHSMAVRLLPYIESAWELSLRRWSAGKSKFNTEEHLLSYVCALYGIIPFDVEPHMRRLWTTHSYRNTKPSDIDLALWHVPAEKRRGILKAFKEIKDENSLFYNLKDEAYRSHMARVLHLQLTPAGQLVEAAKRLALRGRRVLKRT